MRLHETGPHDIVWNWGEKTQVDLIGTHCDAFNEHVPNHMVQWTHFIEDKICSLIKKYSVYSLYVCIWVNAMHAYI